MISNKFLLFFQLLLSPIFCFSQRDTLLQNHKLVEFLSPDTAVVWTYENQEFPAIKLIFHERENEFFVPSETQKRDFILINNEKWTIDYLQGNQECNYTGAYSILECRSIESEYLVFSFVNGFFYGTNQNVFYIILKLENNNWRYLSSYENEADKPIDAIKVVYSKNKIELEGTYLKKIKRQGLNCLKS
jgi:hypothetical protein